MNDAGLERALDQLADGGGPREDWQERVLAGIDAPPATARGPRWPLVAAASGLLTAAAAIALFLGLRAPEPSARPARPVDRSAAIERLQREIDRLSVVKERAAEHLLRAVSEAERAEAEKELAKARARRKAAREALEGLSDRAQRKGDRAGVAMKCDPADPLCGVE